MKIRLGSFPMFWADLGVIIWLRMRLMLRQKLGWMSVLVGCLLVLISLIVSRVSFVNPLKIFWDFALAASFVIQVALSLYLGTQLYPDERNRRTLHIILSSGVSRLVWLLGNGLGIWISLVAMNVLWFALSVGAAYLGFESGSFMMAFQSQLLQSVEVLILVFMAIFFSFYVRPLLALLGCFFITALLHSLSALQRVFTDPQVGRYVDEGGASWILWAARLLPPLEWLDLKPFVGYQASHDWSFVAQMILLGLLWTALISTASWLRFDSMDL
jgi:ABC-type transport system involved in multi-copper enzyme maturation permease subunit